MKHLGSAPVSRTQPDSPGQGAAIPAASTSLSCPVAFGFSHSKALSCQNNLVSCLRSIYNSLRNPERWSCWHFPLFSLWNAWAERCLQQDMNETALNPEAKGGRWWERDTLPSPARTPEHGICLSQAHPVRAPPKTQAGLCSENPGQFVLLKCTGSFGC